MAGEVVHVEFPATDIDRAQRFWSAVFGWSFGDSVMPDMEYRMAQVNDNAGVTEYMLKKAAEANLARVYPIGAVSRASCRASSTRCRRGRSPATSSWLRISSSGSSCTRTFARRSRCVSFLVMYHAR